MSKIKEEVIDMIRRMPEDASVEDIMAELCFRQKVDTGLQQVEDGKTLTHEQVKARLGW